MSDGDNTPAHWEDLTDEQRKELLAIADARIISRKAWAGFYGRLERVRGIGTVILTLAAIWTLFGDAIAQGLNAWLNGSK
jgi:hypothetical protein